MRADTLSVIDNRMGNNPASGKHGEPPVDLQALAETISHFGQLAMDCPDLVEVELNPLVAPRRASLRRCAGDARPARARPAWRPLSQWPNVRP
jgi:hypothetical protein